MKKTILAILLVGAALTASAAPQDATPAGYIQARQQFLAGLAGDGSARDASITAFQSLVSGNPGHPLLLVYQGAATALKGRDAYMPWNKMKFAEDGADTVEKALSQLTPTHDEALFDGAPESVETRVVAATALLAQPDFMNRRASGKRALDAALKSPVFELAPPTVRARALALAAKQAAAEQRRSDEAAYLHQLVAVAPKAAEATRAASRLKELGL
jgi:hypothetical protein